jgi:hypothetical protein
MPKSKRVAMKRMMAAIVTPFGRRTAPAPGSAWYSLASDRVRSSALAAGGLGPAFGGGGPANPSASYLIGIA